MPPVKTAQRFLPWFLLLLALLASMIWQWQGRAHQRLDVGGPVDDGYVLFFHEREQRGAGTERTYRWSQPASEIRLWAPRPGTQAVLTIPMFAPPQADGPQRVSIKVSADHLRDIALTPATRTYQFLVTTPEPFVEGDIALQIESSRLAVGADPRSLGVALDTVMLDTLGSPAPYDLLRELWSVPFLPVSMLLLALSVLLLRLPLALAGGIPVFAMTVLALTSQLVPGIHMMLATYVLAFAFVTTSALLLMAFGRRIRQIWPTNDRRARVWLLAVFVLTLVTTFAPTVQSDGTGYYAYLRSFTMDGDLQFGNEYRDAPFRHGPDPNKRRDTATGHQSNHYAVGPALAWGPLYGVAHLVVIGGQAFGAPWSADGYAEPYVVLSMFTSALAGLVTLLVSYHICRRWVAPSVALLAAVTLFLGSNLLFYAMRESSFAHSLSAMATSLYVLAWLRLEERPSVGRWAVLGAAAGASLLMYWLSVLVLVLPVLTFGRLFVAALRSPGAQRNQELRQLGLGGAIATVLLLLVFSPQLITWNILYGTFITIPQGGEYVRPRVFRGMDFLFSHIRGMLPWSPAFFFGMIGLPLLWRRSRWLTVGLGVAFAAYFWYNASHWQWHAGGAFGPRRMTVLTPWYAIGLALLFDAIRRWRSSAPVAAAALIVAWMTLFTMRYRLFLIPHDPGQIGDVPVLSFYFGLEALPVWTLPGWTSNSFIPVQLGALFAARSVDPLIILLPIMVLATWGVFVICEWLSMSTVRTSHSEPDYHRDTELARTG